MASLRWQTTSPDLPADRLASAESYFFNVKRKGLERAELVPAAELDP